MREDLSVTDLVAAACDGDQAAWNQIVERYAPLVWSICRRYNLERTDTDDVGQTVWLRLVEHLGSLREPAALPGWLAATTRHECQRVLQTARRRREAEHRSDPETASDGGFDEIDHELESAVRRVALREAFTQLRPRCRDLLSQLFAEERASYREIGTKLGMKIGAIGPSRERCLQDLRRCAALAALIDADRGAGKDGGTHGRRQMGR
jgi:RNA polymerase sigma factor (sigma-70 family)